MSERFNGNESFTKKGKKVLYTSFLAASVGAASYSLLNNSNNNCLEQNELISDKVASTTEEVKQKYMIYHN